LSIFSLAGTRICRICSTAFCNGFISTRNGGFSSNIGDWLDTVTPANVRVVASGTFLYGLFLLVGGTGLAFRAKWAIWLAIGESAFFIPIEIFELRAAVCRKFPGSRAPEIFTHPKIGYSSCWR
jgi:hypothetical protein